MRQCFVSHLTYLVVVHYLAKQETQKLRLFTETLYVALPTNTQNTFKLGMWANAQRDGRPAEYRWRHLFNAARSPDLSPIDRPYASFHRHSVVSLTLDSSLLRFGDIAGFVSQMPLLYLRPRFSPKI